MGNKSVITPPIGIWLIDKHALGVHVYNQPYPRSYKYISIDITFMYVGSRISPTTTTAVTPFKGTLTCHSSHLYYIGTPDSTAEHATMQPDGKYNYTI